MIDRSFLYDLLLLLHIFAAIVGFGTVFFNGLYGAQAKQRPGPGGVAIGEANFAVTMVAEWFIYSVPITGILLVLAQGDFEIWKFSQLWVWLSIVLYVVALGISHGSQIPASRRMNELSKELAAAGPPPEGAPPGGPRPLGVDMVALGKRLGAGGAALSLLLVAILVLMVWKPGV
jgi:uncharacterized membrane protein